MIPGFQAASGLCGPVDLSVEISAAAPWWFAEVTPTESHVRYSQPGSDGGNPAYTVTVWGRGEYFELSYSDGGRFIIDSEAKRMWGQLAPLTLEEVGVYVRGPVMGFVLRRLGVAALHACAVSIHGKAVVLCGPSESGKSTTAAALALQGLPVFCDDVTPIREIDGRFHVAPGYPRICLWPDVVEPLFGSPDNLPRLTPNWEKLFFALRDQVEFADQSQELAVIYLFAPRKSGAAAPWIEEVTYCHAFLELVQNTYMNWLLERGQRAVEFDLLARVMSAVPVRRIVPNAEIQHIGSLCELLTRDARQVISSQRRSLA